jgi:hypothetical protein
MKRLFFLAGLFICLFAVSAKAQKPTSINNQPKIILNNNKVRVTHNGTTTSSVSSASTHLPTLLTVLLTDATVTVTTNGKSKTIQAKAGDSFRTGGDTHTEINTGNAPVKTTVIDTTQ